MDIIELWTLPKHSVWCNKKQFQVIINISLKWLNDLNDLQIIGHAYFLTLQTICYQKMYQPQILALTWTFLKFKADVKPTKSKSAKIKNASNKYTQLLKLQGSWISSKPHVVSP
jgi:hypothetical protein